MEEKKLKNMSKKDLQKIEFGKSWIGRRKMRMESAKEKQKFLKWNKLRGY